MNIYKSSNATLRVVINNSTTKIQTLFLMYIKSVSRFVAQDIITLTVILLNRLFQSEQ